MVYLVIAAIAAGIALAVCAIIAIVYLNVCKSLTNDGKEPHYFAEAKGVRNKVMAFVLVIAVAVSIGVMLYSQEKCFGVTADEAFERYLNQIDDDADDYYKTVCGDCVFYVSKENKELEEEWLVYKRNGLFFSREYNVGETSLMPCNDEGTIWANMVEVKTESGFFYYMSFYKDSVLNRVDATKVKINGETSFLTGGKYIITDKKITSVLVLDYEN